jgi:hypothetical protein
MENMNIKREFSSLKLNNNKTKNNILKIESKAYSASDADLKNLNLDSMPLLYSPNNDLFIKNKPISRHRKFIKIKQKKNDNSILNNEKEEEKQQKKENCECGDDDDDKKNLGRSHSARSQEIKSFFTNIIFKRPKSNECKSKIEICLDHNNNLELSKSKLNDKQQQKINQNEINNLIKYRCLKKSGQRFNLLHEGDVCVCKLPHSRNLISKILNLRLLRRWKQHKIVLEETEIISTTVSVLI